MTNEVGRAGFHVTHTKAVSERGAILDEMMRELSEESKARWAARNPNIVVENEDSNIALVNDGKGGFDFCSDPKQVIEYGNARLAKLSSPIREPKLDPVTGKLKGGTTTTSMFVMHLPKSLCKEVPDFYPVYDHDGKEVGRRSRWVARDSDEATKYFLDSIRFLATHVIPGGFDAVLGADIQFSESTPHIQILADTFAPDPKHEGALRCDFSRAYGSHRDVRDDKGRQMSGQAKFRQYHEELKNFMLERGWDIEADVDPLRHDKTATKAVYGALKDQERALAEQEQNFAQNLAKGRSEIDAVVKELADEWENLDTERNKLKQEREQLQNDKQTALEEARSQGYAKGFEEGRAAVERERERLSKEWTTLRSLEGEYDSAIAAVKDAKPAMPSEEEMRKFVREESPALAMRYLAHRDILLRENGKKPFHRESFERFALSRLGTEWKEKWTEPSQTNQAVLDAQHRANDLRGKSAALAKPAVQAPVVQADDGPEFG